LSKNRVADDLTGLISNISSSTAIVGVLSVRELLRPVSIDEF